MGEKFIYVFTKEAKEQLLKQGLSLLRSDEKNQVFVFEDDSAIKFIVSEKYVLSNVLTF